MKALRVVWILLSLAATAFGQSSQSATDLLHAGLTAMGGEEKIRALTGLQFHAIAQRNMLEQSERPEGPYIVESHEVTESIDFANSNWKRTAKIRAAFQPEFAMEETVAGGVAARKFDSNDAPGTGEQLQLAQEALALSPARVLLTGLASSDLRRLPDTTLQSVPHHVVAFTWQGVPVTVYLNADTHLPTEVEWMTAYPYGIFWSIWGDVTTRVYYSFWWLQNGMHYPLQADIVRNGLPDETVTISTIEFNPKFPASEFAISPEMKAAFAASGNKTDDDRAPKVEAAKELAPGIVLYPGAWNTTLVRQDDGIVVLEAPISSGYSAKVIEIAQSKFPGVPIKAVITTSDSWPHIGGLREYVAHGVPVYVLDRTVPLIQRFVAAPRTKYPDTLAKSPKPAQLHPVSGKLVLGTGANRMVLYPIHGETSERQMMVYFPGHKLLYGSDPFQQLPDGKIFYPQTVSELTDAVAREHLDVEAFFMMHIGPNPWSMALQAVQQAP